jgi:hypothetical protein
MAVGQAVHDGHADADAKADANAVADVAAEVAAAGLRGRGRHGAKGDDGKGGEERD